MLFYGLKQKVFRLSGSLEMGFFFLVGWGVQDGGLEGGSRETKSDFNTVSPLWSCTAIDLQLMPGAE